MKPEERDRDLLEYVRESVDQVDSYTQGSLAMPEPHSAIEDALFWRLETLADTCGQLSIAVQQRHPEVPWAEIVGFRNVLAHGYRRLNRERIGVVVERDLPALRAVIEDELRRYEPDLE